MTTASKIEDIREDTTEIRLGGHDIGWEGAKAVAKALEGCKNLQQLEYVCGIIHEGKLSLDNNNIDDEGAKAVAKALEGCKNLTYLKYVCGIIHEGKLS